jgi:hypothetical protein
MVKLKKKVPLRRLSQKFILINQETVLASSWFKELHGSRVRQILLNAYELKVCFDDGRYLIINDYWDLSDKAGVEIDRHMASRNRKECRLGQLIGQRFEGAGRSMLGTAVDLRFSNGLTLTAHYYAVS